MCDWVGKRWTMYVDGVSLETKLTDTMIWYSLIDEGPMMSMNWNREASIQPVCRQVL